MRLSSDSPTQGEEDEELRASGHGLCSLLRRDFGFLVFVILSFFLSFDHLLVVLLLLLWGEFLLVLVLFG